MIHLLLILTVVDLIWLIIHNSVWDKQYNSYYHKIENMKLTVQIFTYVEMALKVGLAVMWFMQFKLLKAETKELFDFSYLRDIDGAKSEIRSKQ